MSELFFTVVIAGFIFLTIALGLKFVIEGIVFYRINEQERMIEFTEWKLDVEKRLAEEQEGKDSPN